tara:strand:- start:50 stop:1111 length:1062 start_codon:yes stop_codon:yes gene_type:complete
MAYTNIDDPSAHFQTALYTGDGSAHSIGNDGNSDLKPDWVWIKKRSASGNHSVFDSTRGVYEELVTNGTNAEASDVQLLTQFDTDGFTVGTNSGVNGSGATFVGWQWKANGGTTSSNTDGATTSTVQANTDAGFSIVTWTGTGSATTLGHGLGVAPAVLIVKNRSTAVDWAVYHKDLTDAGYVLQLNTADGEVDSGTNRWNHTDPTSSVFSVGSGQQTNQSSNNMVCYAFAEKQGYSKFGSYTGNGTANDGPFVYLGFKPAFVIIKSLAATGAHYLWDTKRNTFNGADDTVNAAEADAETSNGIMTVDILSNGFKIKNTGANNGTNQSGTKYVYYAWAENPFVTSTGIPTTAR